jgi:PAS domain S-box-containing protein
MEENAMAVGGVATKMSPWIERLHAAGLVAGTAATAFFLTILTVLIPHEFGHIEPIWVVNAVTLAVLLMVDTRRWPMLLIAATAGNIAGSLAMRDPLWPALALGACNALEIATCAVVLRRWCGRHVDFAHWPHLRVLLLVAPAASATTALLASLALDAFGLRNFLVNFAIWASADALGLLILTPALLALGAAKADFAERPFTIRGLLALGAFVAVTAVVFAQDRYPLLFLIPPALILVTRELERPGTALALLLLAGTATGMTLAGAGPLQLAGDSLTERVIVLQALLAVCTFLGLAVAAQHSQRRRLQASLMAALADAREQTRRAGMAERVARVGYWRLDTVTNRIFWSDQMFLMFGLRIGHEPNLEAAMRMIHPEEKSVADERLAVAVATGQGWDGVVTRLVRPNGDIRYVAGSAVSERGPDGRVTALFGTMMDITDRTVAEMALARSEAHYRQLADNTADTIACYSRDHRILYLTPSVERLTGYAVAELIGSDAAADIHEDDVATVETAHGDLFAGRLPDGVTLQYRVRHKDGHWLWVESRRSLVRDEHGEAHEAIGVNRDISVRKALEAELVEARAVAEAAAMAKADFLANMSHELRTPLTSILGFTRLAAAQPDIGALARGYIERVTDAGEALLAVVNDILDFSKLEAGQLAIRRRPISPTRLARGTLELFAPQAGAKDIFLTFDCVLNDEVVVLADPDRLRQVLLNLVSNALKFTDRGGVTLRLGLEGGRLWAEVVDTGGGIPPDRLSLLFRRFSQVDASNTRAASGTGLGLAICKGLIEAMDGEIGVESEAGKGSRFWFNLPVEQVEAVETEGDAEQVGVEPGLRVLVADDHPGNRELVQLFLRGIGAEVTTACDGFEAVAQADQHPFDVILLDVRMPRLAGPDALRQMREGGRLNATTPVLAFTADADADMVMRLTNAGFDGVVAKPIEPAVLISALLAAASATEISATVVSGDTQEPV